MLTFATNTLTERKRAQENMVTKITWWLTIWQFTIWVRAQAQGTKRYHECEAPTCQVTYLKSRLWLNHHDCFSNSLSFELSVCEVQITLKTGKKISMIKELLQNMKMMCRMKKERKRVGFFNLKMSTITTNCYLLSK